MKQSKENKQKELYFQYNTRLNKLLKIVIDQVRSCKIPISRNIDPQVKINTRAKKRYGACQMVNRNGRKKYTIQISSRLYGSDDKTIQGVIAHELLHTCKGAMNHGEKWKRYAAIMNSKYGYNIKRVSSLEEMGLIDKDNFDSKISGEKKKEEKNLQETIDVITTDGKNLKLDKLRMEECRYVIKCCKCGNIIYRMRKSNVVKNPQNYRCRCGGKLEVYVVKEN